MIHRYKIFLTLGLIVIVLPFLGIPESWRIIILFLLGIILVALSLVMRIQYKNLNRNEDEEIYIENKSSRDFTEEDDDEMVMDESEDETSFENENPYLSGDDNRFENDEEE